MIKDVMTKLKLLVKIHGYTYKDMEEIFFVSKTHITKWVNDDVQIPKDYAEEIGEYFSVSPDILQEHVTSKELTEICKLINNPNKK